MEQSPLPLLKRGTPVETTITSEGESSAKMTIEATDYQQTHLSKSNEWLNNRRNEPIINQKKKDKGKTKEWNPLETKNNQNNRIQNQARDTTNNSMYTNMDDLTNFLSQEKDKFLSSNNT